jgi:hypothetical protein
MLSFPEPLVKKRHWKKTLVSEKLHKFWRWWQDLQEAAQMFGDGGNFYLCEATTRLLRKDGFGNRLFRREELVYANSLGTIQTYLFKPSSARLLFQRRDRHLRGDDRQ